MMGVKNLGIDKENLNDEGIVISVLEPKYPVIAAVVSPS